MTKVNIHEAKTHFSKLLRRVSAGEEIIIARGGTPVARLIPIEGMPQPRTLGVYRDRIHVPDYFDATLPEDILREFEGDHPPGLASDDPPGIESDDPPRTRE